MQTTIKPEAGNKTTWPDLSKDERAWLLAKVAALPGEGVRDTIIRAQQIKGTL